MNKGWLSDSCPEGKGAGVVGFGGCTAHSWGLGNMSRKDHPSRALAQGDAVAGRLHCLWACHTEEAVPFLQGQWEYFNPPFLGSRKVSKTTSGSFWKPGTCGRRLHLRASLCIGVWAQENYLMCRHISPLEGP